ncbi:MAG: metallophosphoesterase, partial [Elusimicrobia bacterium]|nr:metallophosphoesterase [Elusimicrobiota bacterium]
VPSVENAAAAGLRVVAPRREDPRGALAAARALAAPLRTAEQLARLAAAPRAEGETFRFELIGDAEPGRFWFSRALFNRDKSAFWKLLRRADAAGADFIVQLGDMVSRGVLRNFLEFFRRLRAHAPATPFLTVIGNHDRRSPHGVSDDRVYRELFGGTDYAFARGGWRFVVVDTSAGRLTAAQLSWLARALDGRTPTVVFTHMPPAPLGEWTDFGRKGAGGFREGAREFMRLMSERGVKRVYVGHVHALDALERGGVRYVLSGGGGSPLYPGPVARRLHHSLTVELGPGGRVEETVRPLDGPPHAL